MTFNHFKNLSCFYHVDINQFQFNQLLHYAKLLQEWNQKMNLTAIDDFEEILYKHFLDSILIVPLCKDIAHLCDVGSGAGFPGLVLKIMLPDLQITLVEPTKKKTDFLKIVIDELKLDKIQVINARIEDCHDLKEQFDIVTARAVASLPILCELCLPFVKDKGQFIAMKGPLGLQEAKLAENAIQLCGGQLILQDQSTLPDESIRYNLVIQKIKSTPKIYPRVYSQIKKKPL